ncbi:DUF4177 domain-containing protein [Leucobacter denitrificans]|uniref:DUF4177 domain-containing protein n=1 Tax=Leucobacter denitrificans TaxID=683042 RepID=A0A7G9S3Q1_9MICO|nr:DUF4177 domain-containing protein [Leucobacter denitrificans]QNN62476.1 DUF4177 domain-containing protein [Leucobacter denitrificans]
MKEYSFVSIAVQRRREGSLLAKDYQQVVRERAGDGWEFVQAVSFENHAEPRIDLVFSRKVKK